MSKTTLFLFAAVIASSRAAAQSIDADRPHVGTGTHIVPPGQVQFELGLQLNRQSPISLFSSPALVRIGLTDRLEARVSSDGFLNRRDGERTDGGLGNAQAG